MPRPDESATRRRPTWLAPLATVAVTAVVIGGVSWLNRDVEAPVGPGPAETHSQVVTSWFVGDTGAGPRLFSERHSVEVSDEEGPVQAAVDRALTPADDPDYRSPFPSETRAIVTMGAASVTIDLRGDHLGEPPEHPADAQMAIYALALSAQQAATRPLEVDLRVNAATPLEVLGVPLDPALEGKVRMPDDDALLSPLSVDLGEGEVVRPGTPITGSAAAFEATVVWRLLDLDGTQVARGVTTARECCRLSPYSFTPQAPAGRYRLEVSDTDPSGGEGGGPTTDTKTITLE